MWGPWGFGMGLASLVFLALIVIGIVLIVRNPSTAPEPRGRGTTAGQILDERFARGEIDEEEFRRRRDLLSAGAGSR